MNTKKVVINRKYGGFGLSQEAVFRYFEIKGKKLWVENGKWNLKTYWTVPPEERIAVKEGKDFYDMKMEDRREYNRKFSEQTFYELAVERDDPVLVQVVEELGDKADGDYAKLSIVEIPDDVMWEIDDYDGMESIHEIHRSWS